MTPSWRHAPELPWLAARSEAAQRLGNVDRHADPVGVALPEQVLRFRVALVGCDRQEPGSLARIRLLQVGHPAVEESVCAIVGAPEP